MICAHIKRETLEEQSVKDHLSNVSRLAEEYGAKISLSAAGELVGILHDMGKETKIFDSYIRFSLLNPNDKSLKGSIDHSTAGAKFVYDNYYSKTNAYQKLTSQLISLAICSHHGGLRDCLDLKGVDKFTERMKKDDDISYDEAVSTFKSECLDLDQISDLFNKAKEEIKAILLKINKVDSSSNFGRFAVGMLEKYLFSTVIDADRYDTYTFMEGLEQQRRFDSSNLWSELSNLLEAKLESYPKSSKIDLLREDVSRACKSFGKNKTGIYQLSVPTGGGKTLSSLRYALEHAKNFNKDRIFYVIPFTTIIDQNAKEIKDILGHEDMILEHHSNLIIDNEQEDYKLLTERWDSPMIFTTMVQFLETLFSGGTQGVRRMHNLANSIIIFDEIQAIPIKCINMFNSAMNFLSAICNTTIVLCTATQPLLSKTEMPIRLSDNSNIITNIDEKFKQFKRVNLIDKQIDGGYDAAFLTNFVIDKLNQVQSILIIINTKNIAKEIFSKLKEENENLPKESQFYIFHLSTNMCPSHRTNILEKIRNKLGHHRIVCVSTQLIEAGVNISFECVVRSLAGLDSIAQAAGRCNRHGESFSGNVYIVNVKGENVDKLVDIKEGQKCTLRVLDEFKSNPSRFDNDLLSPKAMEGYYQYYFYSRRTEMNYTLPKPDNDKTIYDLLSENRHAVSAYEGRNGNKSELMLRQAFKTAGDYFNVIDQNTTGIIVPYGAGKEIITLINGECSLSELHQYLKKAQQFSVNLYDTDKKKLEAAEAIVKLKDGAILALKDGFYNDDIGVTSDKQPMEFYDF